MCDKAARAAQAPWSVSGDPRKWVSLLALTASQLVIFPNLAAAAEHSGSVHGRVLLIALPIVGIAALVVVAVTLWSRRLDHINDMMSFCTRYVMGREREHEGREAAAALGRVRDPQALLVLLEVVNDEQSPAAVRDAAAEALSDMSGHYRRYRKLIQELKGASERHDHAALIDLLIRNLEYGRKRYVQSAVIIGRALMHQGHYADAKEWLHVADVRNRKTPMYTSRIERLIADCNDHLFAKGDSLFQSGNYHEARERYAAALHRLSEGENNRRSGYLRLACAYCKLGDYEDADQAVLQALHQQQETDICLALSRLLQAVIAQDGSQRKDERQKLAAGIDVLATKTMEKLSVGGAGDLSARGVPPVD